MTHWHTDLLPDWIRLPLEVLVVLVLFLFILRPVVSPIMEPFQRYFALRVRMEHRSSAAREDPRPPFLILRSFFDSNLLHYEILDVGLMSLLRAVLKNNMGNVDIDYLSFLTRAALRHGPMLAIGGAELETERSRNREIAFIDSSESNWEAIFLTIAVSSRAILVVPSTTQGLFKEIAAILAQDLTEKTLVFMPPHPTKKSDWEGKGMDRVSKRQASFVLSRRWAQIQSKWKKRGLNLPPYSNDGMLFIPNRDFSVRRMCPIGKISNLENTLGSLLPFLSGSVRSTIDILDDCVSLQLAPSSHGSR